jgi:hypothetical protein
VNLIDYKDSIQLIKPILKSGGYSSEMVGEVETVSALFIENTGFSHAANRSNIDSDAECYVDPRNEFVVENSYRLEGFYVISNPFNADEDEAWYKVVTVRVGQDKLLSNQVDNVLLFLKKTTEIPYVS